MFDLKAVIAGQVLRLVQTDEVGFGVMGGGVRALDVETVYCGRDRLRVVYLKGHPIGRLRRITLQAFAEFPQILMPRDTSVRGIIDLRFHGQD